MSGANASTVDTPTAATHADAAWRARVSFDRDALIREIEFLASARVTLLSDRRQRGPYHWRDEIRPYGPTGRTALLRMPRLRNRIGHIGSVVQMGNPYDLTGRRINAFGLRC